MSLLDTVLQPLIRLISWALAQGLALLTAAGMSPTAGLTWIIAIVLVVIGVRIALLPLWWRGLRSARATAAMAPQMRELQESYRGRTDRDSRGKLATEQLALRREHGASLLGCFPVLLQSPVFFALFRVLQAVAKDRPVGSLTPSLVDQANAATLGGAHLSDAVLTAPTTTGRLFPLLVVLGTAALMFLTQHLQQRNVVATDPTARFTRYLIYLGPGMLLLSGLFLPLGVLVYLLTSTTWTLGQQMAGMRWWPNPGTEVFQRLERRRARGAGRRDLNRDDAAARNDALAPSDSPTSVRRRFERPPR